jgi:hypothetical protein
MNEQLKKFFGYYYFLITFPEETTSPLVFFI